MRPGLGQLGTHSPKKLQLPPQTRTRRSANPKITIVVPSLNQGKFIEETLQSIIEQDYPKLELIVVDGGSTDCTLRVIKNFEHHITWWTSEPDDGQAAAINKGFRNSTGEILGWLNSDDRLAPGALDTIALCFSSNPQVGVVYGNRILIDENGCEVGRWVLPFHSSRVLRWADFVPQETLYWRRAAWESVGSRLDERFQFAMDWDLLLRFAKMDQSFHHIPAYLGLFRVHQAQKTKADMTSSGRTEMDLIRTRELGYSPARRQIALNTLAYVSLAKLAEVFQQLRCTVSATI